MRAARDGRRGTLLRMRRLRLLLCACSLVTAPPGAALADASERGAAGLALRVATTLARQLADHGRGEEARGAVIAALEAIKGGEDTSDVVTARELVDSLPTDIVEAKELR